MRSVGTGSLAVRPCPYLRPVDSHAEFSALSDVETLGCQFDLLHGASDDDFLHAGVVERVGRDVDHRAVRRTGHDQFRDVAASLELLPAQDQCLQMEQAMKQKEMFNRTPDVRAALGIHCGSPLIQTLI